ncbi:hypothetical protein CfE428DRAFT_1485 [Chthoniobacter flavus Ellin428]|uniref:Uncharacterized protein n=1 Tax=Chthoniobacter flavus Ellin428 TaxID=497964 RepID=B4CY44_9BACT|nr:hypothetical protein CfE428DRAFT_1485 [Chthoniobacter flavus Ellin428]
MTIAKYLLGTWLALLPLYGQSADLFETPDHYSRVHD